MKKSRNTRLDVYGYIFSHFPLCDSLRPLIKEKMIKLNQKDGSSTEEHILESDTFLFYVTKM